MNHKYSLGITVLLTVILSSVIFADEEEVIVAFYCTSAGKVGTEALEDSKAYSKFKDKLEREHDELQELRKEFGEKGSELERPFICRLDSMKKSEMKGKKFERMVLLAKKKYRRDIQEIQQAARMWLDKLMKIDPKSYRQKPPWKNPPLLKERKMPEKYVQMLWHPTVQVSNPFPFRLKFWAAVEPKKGWDKNKPVRLVIRLQTGLSAPKGNFTPEKVKEIEKYGQIKFRREIAGGRAEMYEYADQYWIEIKPDGKWREYSLPVAWEVFRIIEKVQVFRSDITLLFAAADPAVYYFDDVSLAWDGQRLLPEERDILLEKVLLKRRRALKTERKKDEQDDKDRDEEEIKEEVTEEMKKFFEVGLISNGDFNRVFDDFVMLWKRPLAETDEEWDALFAKVTREDGHRGKPAEEEKKTGSSRRRKKDKEEETFKAIREFYIKCDATDFEPELIKPANDDIWAVDFLHHSRSYQERIEKQRKKELQKRIKAAKGEAAPEDKKDDQEDKPADTSKNDETPEANSDEKGRKEDSFNGSFETDKNTDNWPDGWNNPGKRAKAVKENGNTKILLERPETEKKPVSIARFFDVKDGQTAFKITGRVKVTDVKPDKADWRIMKVYIGCLDPVKKKWIKGRMVNSSHQGTSDWQEFSTDWLEVKPGEKIRVLVALMGFGKAEVDDLELHVK